MPTIPLLSRSLTSFISQPAKLFKKKKRQQKPSPVLAGLAFSFSLGVLLQILVRHPEQRELDR